jgi:hypothetical protein
MGVAFETIKRVFNINERTIFGYLCKPLELQKVIQEQADMLLRSRKLPLVLDLDDTLVRVVGNKPGRYVPEHQASQGL